MDISGLHLRDLRYFMACRNQAGISAAARQLGVAQPTLSQAIARLERALGCRLLWRRSGQGGAVVPTEAGELLLRHGLALQQGLDRLAEDLAALDGVVAGELRLGSIQSLNLTLLPPVLAALAERHPRVALVMHTYEARDLADAVRRREVHLGLIAGAPAGSLRGLQEHHLFDEDFIAVVRRDDVLARRQAVDLAELAERDLVLTPEDSYSGRIVHEAFAARGLTPRPRLALNSGETLRELVRAGLGVTILPAGYLPEEAGVLLALPIAAPAPRRRVEAIHVPDPPLPRSARALLDLLPRRPPASAT